MERGLQAAEGSDRQSAREQPLATERFRSLKAALLALVVAAVEVAGEVVLDGLELLHPMQVFR